MKSNKNITEQDIFNFVFFKDNLSNDLIESIESDNSFEEIIAFYSELRENINSQPSDSIKQRIAQKIAAYKLAKIYHLTLRTLKKKDDNSGSGVLAADSGAPIDKVMVQTFIDEENCYAVRLVAENNSSKIFIFNLREKLNTRLTLEILPSGAKYQCQSGSALEIPEVIFVESIVITVNLN